MLTWKLIGGAVGSTGSIDARIWQYSGSACVTLLVPTTSGDAEMSVADVILPPDVGSLMVDAGIDDAASDSHGTRGASDRSLRS